MEPHTGRNWSCPPDRTHPTVWPLIRKMAAASIWPRGGDARLRSTPAGGSSFLPMPPSPGKAYWTKTSTSSTSHSIQGSPACSMRPASNPPSGRLYMAAWGRRTPSGDTGGGIFLSTDAAKSWKSVLDKDQHIFDVTLEDVLVFVQY